jgi:AAA+ ATPase superfamily predicted ATPase
MREKFNIRLTNIGRWWDKNTEIDIVGFNAETQEIVFGEVKWTNKPVGINIYKDLVEKSEKVDWKRESRREYFIFFSKNGFTNELTEFSQDKNIILITKDDL